MHGGPARLERHIVHLTASFPARLHPWMASSGPAGPPLSREGTSPCESELADANLLESSLRGFHTLVTAGALPETLMSMLWPRTPLNADATPRHAGGALPAPSREGCGHRRLYAAPVACALPVMPGLPVRFPGRGQRDFRRMTAVTTRPCKSKSALAFTHAILAQENILAVPSYSATVAPILHGLARMKSPDRGTTLNNGAADADGR